MIDPIYVASISILLFSFSVVAVLIKEANQKKIKIYFCILTLPFALSFLSVFIPLTLRSIAYHIIAEPASSRAWLKGSKDWSWSSGMFVDEWLLLTSTMMALSLFIIIKFIIKFHLPAFIKCFLFLFTILSGYFFISIFYIIFILCDDNIGCMYPYYPLGYIKDFWVYLNDA
jgi:hypothetical protein